MDKLFGSGKTVPEKYNGTMPLLDEADRISVYFDALDGVTDNKYKGKYKITAEKGGKKAEYVVNPNAPSENKAVVQAIVSYLNGGKEKVDVAGPQATIEKLLKEIEEKVDEIIVNADLIIAKADLIIANADLIFKNVDLIFANADKIDKSIIDDTNEIIDKAAGIITAAAEAIKEAAAEAIKEAADATKSKAATEAIKSKAATEAIKAAEEIKEAAEAIKVASANAIKAAEAIKAAAEAIKEEEPKQAITAAVASIRELIGPAATSKGGYNSAKSAAPKRITRMRRTRRSAKLAGTRRRRRLTY